MGQQKRYETVHTIRPGDEALRRKRRPRRRLKPPPRARFVRFLSVIITQTPFLKMVSVLVVLWLLFSAGVYFAERGMEGTTIYSYGRALYWGVAAFSTAGIADTPLAGTSQIVGGIWIVVGSTVFFGTIIATITTYFMRPLQHPVKQIVNTIEYNLEKLEDLTTDELVLLKETTDMLIDHIEQLKQEQPPSSDSHSGQLE